MQASKHHGVLGKTLDRKYSSVWAQIGQIHHDFPQNTSPTVVTHYIRRESELRLPLVAALERRLSFLAGNVASVVDHGPICYLGADS